VEDNNIVRNLTGLTSFRFFFVCFLSLGMAAEIRGLWMEYNDTVVHIRKSPQCCALKLAGGNIN
jgi:hypothetical protein